MSNDLALVDDNASVDDLAALEIHDSALRYAEGPVPPGYVQSMGQMEQQGAPAWYKNPTFLTVVGAGAVALLLVCVLSKKRD